MESPLDSSSVLHVVSSARRAAPACHMMTGQNKQSLQVLQSTHHDFWYILLAKGSHRARPDSRTGEIDSTLRWEELKSHMAKDMDGGGAENRGHV